MTGMGFTEMTVFFRATAGRRDLLGTSGGMQKMAKEVTLDYTV